MATNKITKKSIDQSNTNPRRDRYNTLGKCIDCGHTWQPRGKIGVKPNMCSRCKSENCIWVDKPDSPPEHKILDIKPVIIDADEEPACGISCNSVEPQIIALSNTNELRPYAGTEEESLTVSEVLRSVVGDNVQFIDNPTESLDYADAEEPPIVVWQNTAGELSYGAIVNPETLEEVKEVLATREAETLKEPTLSDIDILREAGLINPVIEDYAKVQEPEEAAEYVNDAEELEEEEPDEKRGNPFAVVLIPLGLLAGVGALATLAAIDTKKAQQQQQQAQQKKQRNGAKPTAIEESMRNSMISNVNRLYGREDMIKRMRLNMYGAKNPLGW